MPQRLQRFRHGPGVCKVDYALSGPVPWLHPDYARSATIHLGGSLEHIEESEQAVWEGHVAETPFILLVQQSNFDEERAPEGQHTLWAYCHVPQYSNEDYSGLI